MTKEIGTYEKWLFLAFNEQDYLVDEPNIFVNRYIEHCNKLEKLASCSLVTPWALRAFLIASPNGLKSKSKSLFLFLKMEVDWYGIRAIKRRLFESNFYLTVKVKNCPLSKCCSPKGELLASQVYERYNFFTNLFSRMGSSF